MKKRVPIAIAAALATCGAAALTIDNGADSKPSAVQKSGAKDPAEAAIQRARDLNNATDQGGMAGCFDPSLSGYPRRMAEAAGGSPCDEDDVEAETSGAGGDAWAGTYEGPFDGGEGSVVIRQGANASRYMVKIKVAGEGCSGDVSGEASLQAGRLVLVDSDGENQCRVTLTRSGNSLSVAQSGCSAWHGMSCGFSGSATRKGGGVAAAPTSRVQATSLVGAWVERGEACGGEGLVIRPDGTFMSIGELGRWQLSGNALILTVTDRGEMGDELPVQNPRPVRSTILSSSARAFTMKDAKGAVSHMVRCE